MPNPDRARTALVYLFRQNGPDLSVLLLKRVDRPGLPGFWQGVSGRCEKGESYEAAAVREVAEETGFRVEVRHARHAYSFASTEHPGLEIHEEVFYAYVEGEPKLSWEHTEYQWCSVEAALQLLLWEDNKAGLRKAVALALPLV